MRFVVDTNVVVAGLRSPTGATAALIDRALRQEFTMLLSVPLVLEYEAACRDPEQRIASWPQRPKTYVMWSPRCVRSGNRCGQRFCGGRSYATRPTR